MIIKIYKNVEHLIVEFPKPFRCSKIMFDGIKKRIDGAIFIMGGKPSMNEYIIDLKDEFGIEG